MNKYQCVALINNYNVYETIEANSDKQAWYFYSKKHGFKHRNFNILSKEIIENDNIKNDKYEQITFF